MNRFAYKYRQQNNQNSRFSLNHFLVIVCAVLIGVQVYVSNKVATTGQELSSLANQIVSLEDQNRKLLSENVNELSLQQLEKYAQELGYVEATDVIQIGTDNTVLASKQ